MNDPWDVKSVRLSDQYISCMKINGVPLLPPVLSKECRKEMQYYKLLAKEVEKRIRLLIPYVNDCEGQSIEDKTDAPDLPQDYELFYELPKEDIQSGFQVNIEKITAITKEELVDNSSKSDSPDLCDSKLSSNQTEPNEKLNQPPKFLIDLSLNINENGINLLESVSKSNNHDPQPTDPPERDYNNSPKKTSRSNVQKELLLDTETYYHKKKSKAIEHDLVAFNFDIDKLDLNRSDPFPDMPMEGGPHSLSAKSFTGSLNNIHTECMKETQLVRQRSYTVLNPSPMLLAHLQIQSLNTGVEVNSISMSESGSNLYTKKRRSWDLESAKVKWSSMALELNQRTAPNILANSINKNYVSRTILSKTRTVSPMRVKLGMQDKNRRGSFPTKVPTNSEPIQRAKKCSSPVRSIPSSRTIARGPTSKSVGQKYSTRTPNQQSPIKQPHQSPVSEPNNPAARVRELYEKIQNQQLVQMANLVEKQKREQLLLQQIFEEQNSILYKQLKTICPKAPIEVKEAWPEKVTQEPGPVSLSQLINSKTPDKSSKSPTSTLTDTRTNLNKCNMILKKSKDITSTIKKQLPKRGPNKPSSPKAVADGNRTRTHSPTARNSAISRKLNYDTSPTDDKELDTLEYMLTDRTNDTLAELNVTFPTDSEEPASAPSRRGARPEPAPAPSPPARRAAAEGQRSSTDSAIRSMEETIYNSMNTIARKQPAKPFNNPLTPKQRWAAATLGAHARGFLVRRLLRTARVQATVQTIRDALQCALQLHRDRAGIRGADVDLHRRLIQQALVDSVRRPLQQVGPQITAACYSLHDTFVASSPAERCALIAADRERKRQKPAPARNYRQKSDIMSQSHSGSFPARAQRSAASLMTQSNYETFSGDKVPRRCVPSPRRRPWR